MKVPDTSENFKKCFCSSCPTYDKCMKQKMQRIFCTRGKTDCTLKKYGCICGSCPLAMTYKLTGEYFCETGAVE